jgi:hypothetical protein
MDTPLSQHIWLCVFEYLSPFEKLVVSQVCKDWNGFVERRCLWKTIDFGNRKCGRRRASLIAKTLETYAGDHTSFVQVPIVTPEIKTALHKKCTTGLKYLRVGHDKEELDGSILLPNLRELFIKESSRKLYSFIRRVSVKNTLPLHRLERLELQRVHISRDLFDRLFQSPRLKHVLFHECVFHLNVDAIMNAIHGTLNSLDIDNCMFPPTSDYARGGLADLLPLKKCVEKVHYMKLESWGLWSKNNTSFLEQFTKDVECLSLNYFGGHITKILGRNLCELTLVRCLFAKDEFKKIHVVCPSLKRFQLLKCSKFGVKSVKSLSKLRNLTVYLSLERVTSATLLRLHRVNHVFVPWLRDPRDSEFKTFALRLTV